MSIFTLSDHFQIVPGSQPIVVGAPHHGTRPNVAADRGAGPIALALAQRLGARAVVVSDLRRTVDVNKNPLQLSRLVRSHALRYQNEMFRQRPSLIIEIHGHVSGQYDVEITTGFDLDPHSAADAPYLERLARLKQQMPAALAGRLGRRPSVGVYPLDRNVEKTATNTFTFQKIRRARSLAGLKWYGLHIELNAAMRTGPQAKKPAYINALADVFAAVILDAFAPLPDEGDRLPQLTVRQTAVSPRTLKIVAAPAACVSRNIAIVHPDELNKLDALDGDAVLLQNGLEELRSVIAPSHTVQPGQIAVPARLRRQISADINNRIAVGRLTAVAAQPARTAHNSYVLGAARPDSGRHLWLSPDDLAQAGWDVGQAIYAQGQPHLLPVNTITAQSDPNLPPRIVSASGRVTDRLSLTLGEVITLRQCS